MNTRGLPLSPERRAALEAALLSGASYNDPRLAGYSCSTIVRHRRRLGLSPSAGAPVAGDQPAPPPEKPAPYRPGGSAADRRIVELEAEVARLRAELKRAHHASLDDEAMREILGRIGATTVRPPEWMIAPAAPAVGRGKTPEVPVALVSDWHGGEVVSRAGVRGYNAFSPAILEERVRRLASSIIRIADEYGPGAYAGFVLAILGDMVSGGLHPELAKTDEEERIPSALRVLEILIWLVRELKARFGRVYVPCVAGNHGRETDKPEFKRYVFKNFDWMIYQLLAREFAGDPDIVIDAPEANEVHFRVWSMRFLATHGDMLGVKGGDGIIGSIGPIMRGEIKVRGQVSTLGLDYDVALMGHWHQELWLPRAIVNNTLKGFDEYARLKLRAPPTPPTQSLFFVHPRRGITSRWSVQVEAGSFDRAAPWVSWQQATAVS